MRYRTLGKTGIDVSEIGFGAWGIGGDSYGLTDDNRSREALLCAVDEGITLFDTSDIYGAGHSESLIGKALSSHRDKIIIATKGGALPHTGREMPQDFSIAHMRKALEKSLHRLKTDYVDLYQLHSPSLKHLTDELVSLLVSFKESGMVRALGASVRSPADGLALLDRYAFDAVQVNFNMMDQRALENGLFERAAQTGIGIIARTPFNFGFLAGRLDGLTFDEKDHRRNWPKEQLELWSTSATFFEALCNGQRTKAQLALQFCLSFDAVSAVIPGMLKRDEVLENVAANRLPRLTADEVGAIVDIYRTNTFVDEIVKKKALHQRYDQKPKSTPLKGRPAYVRAQEQGMAGHSENMNYQDVHYAASDLWKGEQKTMAELASRVPSGGTIVEIGTWQGGTTRLLYDVTHEHGVRVCTVDVAPQAAAYERLQGTDVEVIAASSMDAARQWAGSSRKPIDLLFIDGSHLFQDVFQDFNAWAPFINPGATLVFHDYDPPERGGIAHPGVQVLVDTLIRLNIVRDTEHRYKLFYGVLPNPQNSAVDATACSETFIGLAKKISNLWESDYSGWELICDDRLALLLRHCLSLDGCGYTWPPREIIDQADKKYLVSAHPLYMPLDFMAQVGISRERVTWIDSLKACYLIDHFLSERYQALLSLSADRREFVKWADAIFTFEHGFGSSPFPGSWSDIPRTTDGAELSRMIAREQVKLNILARILSTFVDWMP